MSAERKAVLFWLAVGAAGFLVVPWYAVEPSLLSTAWISTYSSKESAPGLVQSLEHGRIWLMPIAVVLLAVAALLPSAVTRVLRSRALLVLGALGLAWLVA